MKLSFCIEKWHALSSGLSNQSDWITWADKPHHDWKLSLPKQTRLPMIQARRMSIPSRLAVEVGLELIDETTIDYAIFVSRHGELERTHKILTTLNNNNEISPTDFALSVHNTASGLLTIIAKKSIPITSISAGQDGFHQGLIEAQSLLSQKDKKVLLIDFDGPIPEMYHPQITPLVPAYAVGFILSNGNMVSAESSHDTKSEFYQEKHPQALSFLRGLLSDQEAFTLKGERYNWQWVVNH